MAFDERTRGVPYDRKYFSRHELAVPGVEGRTRVPRERFQLKIEELVYIEGARSVLVVKALITCFIDFPIEHVLFDQKLRPLEITVARKQSVIQIEQGELHTFTP
jgi:hypothetical protein